MVLDIIARKTAKNNILLLIWNSMEIDFTIEWIYFIAYWNKLYLIDLIISWLNTMTKYKKQKFFLMDPVYCDKITRSWNCFFSFRESSSWSWLTRTLNPIKMYFLPKSNCAQSWGYIDIEARSHWDPQNSQNMLKTALFLKLNQIDDPVAVEWTFQVCTRIREWQPSPKFKFNICVYR